MVTIEFGNILCRINNIENERIEYTIANELSYEMGGFGQPKRMEFLYNVKTHKTYTGLIPHITRILNYYHIEYKLEDKRIKPTSNGNYHIDKAFSPRQHQKDIIDRSSSREVIQAATGAGKTFIMAALIAKFNVKYNLIIAPKVSLAVQLQKEISKFLSVEVGLVTGDEKNIKNITVATPQAIMEYGFINKCEAIFFDETHNVPSFTIKSVACAAKNAYYRIGVSATPWRDGNDDILIEAVLNIRKAHLSLNASKLIKLGLLVPCEINFVEIDNSHIKWQGSYNSTYDAVITYNQERNNKILNLVKHSIKTRKSILILIKKIEHGNIILNMLRNNIENKTYKVNNNGKIEEINTIEFLSGNDPSDRREFVFDQVRKGICKILIGSTIADEGLDITCLDCLILAGAGKSSTRAFQRIGRVLRLHKGKINALVYDIRDMNTTFYNQSLVREALYKTEELWKVA